MICPECHFDKWDGRSTHLYGGRASAGLNCFGPKLRFRQTSPPPKETKNADDGRMQAEHVHGSARSDAGLSGVGSDTQPSGDDVRKRARRGRDPKAGEDSVKPAPRTAVAKRRGRAVLKKPQPSRYIEEDDGTPAIIAPVTTPPEIAKLEAEGKLTRGSRLQSAPAEKGTKGPKAKKEAARTKRSRAKRNSRRFGRPRM